MSATHKSDSGIEHEPLHDNIREDDSDEYSDHRNLIEDERDGDNPRRDHQSQGGKAMDGCVYLAAHIVLVCLSFIMLNIWLSYGPDECPSF